MKKILIVGDSFAADWTVKYQGIGWPNMLSKNYKVVNVAEAGCSQYKIYLQLLSQKLSRFDKILVCHTSPYRLYTKKHPLHFNDNLHHSSDFIYADVVENLDQNLDLKIIKDYYEKFFSEEYAIFIHRLICKELDIMLNRLPVIHLSFFDYKDLYSFDSFYSFYDVFQKHRGNFNHLNEQGNKLVFYKLKEII